MKYLIVLPTMLVSFLSLLAAIIVAKGFGFSSSWFHSPEMVFKPLTMITVMAVLILPIAVVLLSQKFLIRRPFSEIGLRQPLWQPFAIGSLIGLGLKAFATVIAYVSSENAHLSFSNVPSFMEWIPYFAWFLITLFLNSLNEEIAYRSFPIQNLKNRSSNASIVIVFATALLFSLMHFLIEKPELWHFLYRFAFGVVVGIIYLRSSSLWKIVGLHTGWNFVALSVGSTDWRVGNLIQAVGIQNDREIIVNVIILSVTAGTIHFMQTPKLKRT